MESFSAAKGISNAFTVVFKHNENSLYDIAKIAKEHGARTIYFIQSNRFYNNKKFDFVDATGTQRVLERAEKENDKSFYELVWNLNNENDLERIYNETIKQ